MRRLHDGIEHVGETHHATDTTKDGNNDNKAKNTSKVLFEALLFILHITYLGFRLNSSC
jgi:hypothetical protein